MVFGPFIERIKGTEMNDVRPHAGELYLAVVCLLNTGFPVRDADENTRSSYSAFLRQPVDSLSC